MVSPKGDHVLGVPGGDAPERDVPGTARPETEGQREISCVSAELGNSRCCEKKSKPMLSIIIIALILVGLTVHRYLSGFYEHGMLPYSNGFLVFANFFTLTCLVSFIWTFGIMAGVIVALMCFFQIPYHAVLWIFIIIPNLLNKQAARNIRKNPSFSPPVMTEGMAVTSLPKVNLFPLNLRMNLLAYEGFCFLVLIVTVLTAVNFFVSPYKIMWILIRKDVWTIIVVFAGVLFLGNVARVVCYKLWLRGDP